MTLFGKTIVGLIIIIIGGIGYYFYRNSQSNKIVNEAKKEEATSTTPTGKKIAFSHLIAQNGTYKCTVNQYVANVESKGTVYTDKGLLRGEFTTAVMGKNINTIMILRDGYTYTWISTAPTIGWKSKTNSETNISTNASSSGAYLWNADQIGDYNCEAWTVDESVFTVPTSIKFTATN